jgi:hypothetical protein
MCGWGRIVMVSGCHAFVAFFSLRQPWTTARQMSLTSTRFQREGLTGRTTTPVGTFGFPEKGGGFQLLPTGLGGGGCVTGADSPGCAAATPLCCFLAGADLDDSLADEFDTDALSARRTDRPNNGLPYAATLQTAATTTKLAYLIELPRRRSEFRWRNMRVSGIRRRRPWVPGIRSRLPVTAHGTRRRPMCGCGRLARVCGCDAFVLFFSWGRLGRRLGR